LGSEFEHLNRSDPVDHKQENKDLAMQNTEVIERLDYIRDQAERYLKEKGIAKPKHHISFKEQIEYETLLEKYIRNLIILGMK
jgi:hypothetical protein